jgi:hypothetical protein
MWLLVSPVHIKTWAQDVNAYLGSSVCLSAGTFNVDYYLRDFD